MTTPSAQTRLELADKISLNYSRKAMPNEYYLPPVTLDELNLIGTALRASQPAAQAPAGTFDDNTTDWRKIAPELDTVYAELCTRLSGSAVDELMEYIARVFRQKQAPAGTGGDVWKRAVEQCARVLDAFIERCDNRGDAQTQGQIGAAINLAREIRALSPAQAPTPLDWSKPLQTNESPPRHAILMGSTKSTLEYFVVKIDGESHWHPPGEYRVDKTTGFIRGTLIIRNAVPPQAPDAVRILNEKLAEIRADKSVHESYRLGRIEGLLIAIAALAPPDAGRRG